VNGGFGIAEPGDHIAESPFVFLEKQFEYLIDLFECLEVFHHLNI
jgi:hypothetical protein